MTTPMIPEFILTLYENEVRAIVKKVNVAISKEYNLNVIDLNNLVEEKVGLKLAIIPEEFENIKIVKKKCKNIDPEIRCIARIKKDGLFCQCSAKFKEDKICGKHLKSKMIYGTINDPLPEEKFKRKTKIY